MAYVYKFSIAIHLQGRAKKYTNVRFGDAFFEDELPKWIEALITSEYIVIHPTLFA